MDMIERVARALADGGHLGVTLAFRIDDADKGSIPRISLRDTERAMAAARAAIEAMRDNPAAADAIATLTHSGTWGQVEELWSAGIDASLTP